MTTIDKWDLPEVRRFTNRVVGASTHATDEQKEDARKRVDELFRSLIKDEREVEGEPLRLVVSAFGFNAYLLCLADGRKLTDENLIDAAKRIFRASERFAELNRLKRAALKREREEPGDEEDDEEWRAANRRRVTREAGRRSG